MATLTASAAGSGAQPRAVHVNETTVAVTFSLTAAASAGDVLWMTKIPVGVRVTTAKLNANAGSGNVFPITTAIGGTTLGSVTAASGLTDYGASLPLDISVSDDAVTRYALATITVGTITSATATGSISLTLGWLKGEEGLQA